MDAEAAASLMTTAAAPGGLVVEDFTVKYGKFTAVDLVRLAVGPATVTALLGLNGAGKSSLLRGLMGWCRAREPSRCQERRTTVHRTSVHVGD